MVESKAIDAVKFLEQRVMEKGLDIPKIILLGSQAQGKATAGSDGDFEPGKMDLATGIDYKSGASNA